MTLREVSTGLLQTRRVLQSKWLGNSKRLSTQDSDETAFSQDIRHWHSVQADQWQFDYATDRRAPARPEGCVARKCGPAASEANTAWKSHVAPPLRNSIV